MLLCCDLFEFLLYVCVDNMVFCLLKNNILGFYIFIFKGIKEVLCCLMNEKWKIIGIWVLNNKIVLDLLEVFGELFMLILLILLGNDFIEFDFEEICDCLEYVVDVIFNGGYLG